MLITDYMHKDCIKLTLEGNSKEAVIRELLNLLIKKHPDINTDMAFQEILQREQLESTAIGKGVIIPHARVENCEGICVALGFIQNDTKIICLDGTHVQIVILILFQKDKPDLQLRFLARVARLLQHVDFHDSLLSCTNIDSVMETLKNCEDKHIY